MYRFHTSSVTFPLVHTQYPRAHKCCPQYRFLSAENSDNSLCELLPFKYCTARDTEICGGIPSACARDPGSPTPHRFASPCSAQSPSATPDISAQHPLPVPHTGISSSTPNGTCNPTPYDFHVCSLPSPPHKLPTYPSPKGEGFTDLLSGTRKWNRAPPCSTFFPYSGHWVHFNTRGRTRRGVMCGN